MQVVILKVKKEGDMKYIGSLDLGTTSVRFILFNKSGQIVTTAQKSHKQIYPKKGWVEQNPIEILKNTKAVFKEALEKSQVKETEITAIGITNQRETTVVWNKQSGLPYYNAIVWQDTRTKEVCDSIKKYESIIKEKTGLPIATYFSATKMKWLFDNIDKIKKDAERGLVAFGTIDSWIIWNLSEKLHITDVTNASRTMLMNIKSLQWDEELLAIFGLEKSILPKIKSSSEIYGYIKPNTHSIPLSGILGDQQAALFGHRCFDKGDAKNTYGTGCFLLLNTGKELVYSENGLITTPAYQMKGEKPVYALEGSVAVAGSLIEWYKNNLGMISSPKQISEFASEVKDNGGVYFVPAFSGLFAPYWDNTARGMIVGITHYTNKYHLSRAILEAIAYQTKDLFSAMEKDTGIKLNQIRTDGGLTKSDFLMQFQADILNIPVKRSKITEITALGAAFAAGLATGFWKDKNDLPKIKTEEFLPQMKEEIRKRLYKEWKKAIEKSKGWL